MSQHPNPAAVQAAHQFVADVRTRVGKVVVGQDVVVERVMIALLTGGHLLLQGMPGLAKTLLVNTVAKAIALDFRRIQFTVDMLPSDIVGSEVVDQKTGDFRIHRGPVFTNLLLADEINRAAPKVQGAMLEAMQERKVTLGGQTMRLPTPFLVIATQNPVEQSGTFELPEAQLDRFMLLHRLGYPGRDEEQDILQRQLGMGLRKEEGGAVPKTAFDMIDDSPVGTKADLVAAMEAVQAVHEVEGIGDAHDPKPGEEESQGGVQGGAEGGLKPHPHGHEEEGGKRLDEEAEEGRKAELVVNEAHKHEPGSPQEDGEDLDEHLLHQDGPEEGRHHQGEHHPGVEGEPPGVGEGLPVEPALVGQVGPAHLQGEAAHVGQEAPGEEEGQEKDEEDGEPAPPVGVGHAQAVEELQQVTWCHRSGPRRRRGRGRCSRGR